MKTNKKSNTDPLNIQGLSMTVIQNILKSERLFDRFLKLNGGFINSIINRTIGPDCLDREDYFQVGCLALYKSLQKYSLNKGAKFSTFAFIIIQNALKDELKVSKHNKIAYHESSIELFFKKNDSLEQTPEYYEDSFKTNKIDFTEDICNKIIIEEFLSQFSELEKEIYQLKVIEELSINRITSELAALEKYNTNSLSESTISNIFYQKIKPKLKKLWEDLKD